MVLTLLLVCAVLNARTKEELKAETMFLQGLELYQKGDVKNAGTLLEAAVKLDSLNDAAHYYLAYIAAADNDAGKALDCFEKAYALDTANVWYSLRLAHLYSVMGRLGKADTLYTSLSRRRSGDPEILSSLAEVRLQESRYDDVDSLLSRIERIEGQTNYVDLTRIELSRQRGDYTELFLRLDEYFSREEIPSQMKTDILNRMLKGSDPRFNYMHIQDYDKLFQTCLRVHPSDTAVAHLAGDFLFASGKQDRLLELCSQFRKDPHMVGLQSYVLFRNADYQGAIASCERLMELVPDDKASVLEAMTMRADCKFFMNDPDGAFRDYERVLKMDKGNIVALNNYAYYLSVVDRKLSKAAKMSAKAIAAEPENATYLDTYGWILFKQKKYEKAKEVFKRVLIHGGNGSPEVLDHYAAVLDALGESALAEGYRQQASIKRNGSKK